MPEAKYTTKQKVEDYIGEKIHKDISSFINSAQKYIENYTNRNFIAKEETRMYKGNGKLSIVVDPFLSITKLEVKQMNEWVEINDFEASPYNSNPKVRITLLNDIFPKSFTANVRIEGKFGYSETPPADIVYVATILVAYMYKGVSKNEVSSEKIGEYSVSYNQDKVEEASILDILDRYKVLI